MMSVSGVRVRIYDEEKCIHDRETVRSVGDDLETLMRNLRDVQSEVNEFLTALIQQQDISGEMANRSISQDIESNSAEENEDEEENEESEAQANPKKCKLSV